MNNNNKQLRILDIMPLPVYPPNYGGAIGSLYKAIELAKRGHNIDFITSKDPNSNIDYSGFEDLFKNNVYLRKKNRLKSFVSILPYNCNRFGPDNNEKDIILGQIKKVTYDLIIFEYPHSYRFYKLLKQYIKEKQIPIVYYSHNIESDYLLRSFRESSNLIKKIFFLFDYFKMIYFEKFVLELFDVIFTVSIQDKDKINLLNPKAHAVWIPPIIPSVNNGNELSLPPNFNFLRNNFYKKILFTGILSHDANKFAIKWFTESVMPILRKKIKCFFVIVGKDPSKEILELAELNKDIFVFSNVVSLAPFYNLADLVVIPLFNEAGIKIKLIEALRYGKKVVSRPEGVYGSGLQDIIPIADSPIDFATKCIQSLEGRINYLNVFERFDELYSSKKIIDTIEKEIVNLADSKK